MAVHLGESGGEGAASQILSVLADFIVVLSTAIKKYDDKEAARLRREAAEKKKNGQNESPVKAKSIDPKRDEKSKPLVNARAALMGALASRAREGVPEKKDKLLTPARMVTSHKAPTVISSEDDLKAESSFSPARCNLPNIPEEYSDSQSKESSYTQRPHLKDLNEPSDNISSASPSERNKNLTGSLRQLSPKLQAVARTFMYEADKSKTVYSDVTRESSQKLDTNKPLAIKSTNQPQYPSSLPMQSGESTNNDSSKSQHPSLGVSSYSQSQDLRNGDDLPTGERSIVEHKQYRIIERNNKKHLLIETVITSSFSGGSTPTQTPRSTGQP